METPAPEADEPEIQRIQDRIDSILQDALSKNEVYFLSQLGKDLGEDLQRLKLLTQKSVSEFIRERLPMYQVARLADHQNVLVAIMAPPGLRDHDELLRRIVADRDIQPAPSYPRYNKHFWAAFAVPVKPDHTRYLNRSTLMFEDRPYQDNPGEDELIVPSTLVPAEGIVDRDKIVALNIDAWLAQHPDMKDRVLAKSLMHPRPVDTQPQIPSATLLSAFLDSLDPRQLRENKLSLDVIATLAKTRRP